MFKQLLIPLLAGAGVLGPSPAAAQAPDDHDQISDRVEAALLDLGARGALGESGEPLTISRPAQVRYELAAIIDARSADEGLQVLAVTPGGAGERMGLEAGDRLLAINGTGLADVADPASVLEQALQGSDGNVRLQVSRGGRRVRLAGSADVAPIPAYELTIGPAASTAGCGYVTDELGATPRDRGIYDAVITRIDGRGTPVSYRPNRYLLDAGRHVLMIREDIDDYYRFTGLQQKHRQIARTRSAREGFYKPLVVDVKPGASYRIGVKLLEDQLDLGSIRAHEYWEPVVYGTAPVNCE